MPADDLTPGDFVYHKKSGTARLLGLTERQVDGKPVSYFELEFAGGDKIFVPVDRTDLLERVPKRGDVRVDRLKQTGGPPPPPRALVLDRANRIAGGSGLGDGNAPDSDPLLEAAQRATPERRQAVEQARQNWIARLIDVSRRNRLLYFQPLKVRTVELDPSHLPYVLKLLAGETVPVARMFNKRQLVRGDEDQELLSELEELDDEQLGVLRRLQEIQKRGNEDFEERGLETVYLTYGMATWTASDGGRSPEAPVIMVPISVAGKGARISLQPNGDIEINLALTHVLEEEFGCEGLGARLEMVLNPADDTEATDSAGTNTQEPDPASRAEKVFSEIRTAAAGSHNFDLTPRSVIGNFAFQKLAMVRDLQGWEDRIAGHDVVAALAGDVTAKRELSENSVEFDARELDKKPPELEFLVMDADASQLRAIAGILQGDSGVVIGPPGTGKSQTIANLIGELVANGKRVLFVAEKRAALEVVKDRLAKRGLGELVLDVHGAVSRKSLMSQFASSLKRLGEILEPRVDDLHRQFVARRERLNEYDERLHRYREPSGHTGYELIGKVLALQSQGAYSKVRWKGSALKRMTQERIAQIEEIVRRAAAEPELVLRTSRSPWTEARLGDAANLEAALSALDEALKAWEALRSRIEHCAKALGLAMPESLADCAVFIQLVIQVNEFLSTYSENLFKEDLPALTQKLAPARSLFGGIRAQVFEAPFRAAKTQVLTLRHTRAGGQELLRDLERAAELLNAWTLSSHGDSLPKSYEDAEKLKSAYAALMNGLTELARYVDVPSDSESLRALSEALEDLDADRQTAMKIPAIRQYERELDELGVTAFVDEIRTEGSSSEHWTPILRFAWLSSCLEQLLVDEPELAVFNGREHDKVVAEFKALDKARLEVAVHRVMRAWAESARAARNQHRDQDLLLGHQANLQRRHLPFRELLRRAPDVVTAVKPCWMASPLSVSQVLGGNRQYFDVVIFDEASQVLPEDAVTSILRGRSVVVAGDPDQLPPTAFFAVDRDDRDTDPTEDTEGFESILKVMESFLPQWNLDWHYRSRDERLIAFSNHYIYKDRLVTFPSNGTADAFAHVLVSQSQFNDADELSASDEVSKVVELVLEHAERCPDMSLGVIAFGIKHSNRIDAELAKARRIRPDLDAFFDAHPDEKFFVKNLERVQGDERDAIILSVGYGKVAGGTLRYYFGPLLSEHGYRRLNVAATRAKSRLTLVSSFGHQDMDPARSDRRGVELLRLYLQYAASGGEVFGDSGPTTSEPNEFEIEVQRALENEGLAVVPQFGASRYRIDLVVQHPEQPGRYVLAVECDGATYHSSLTARDRDRLRQEHLEARGWRFVRIWSTDWFMRRSEEVARVVHAYRRALEPTEESDARVSAELLLAPPTESAGRRPRLSRLNPHNPPGLPIWRYRDEDLIRHACWIRSDGRLRTDEELLKLMLNDLKLTRRAEAEARVMDAILQANNGACDELDP